MSVYVTRIPDPHATSTRVMVITGGSRGIGAATARLAAKRGWRVAFSYRSREALAQGVVDEIMRNGGQAFAVQADMGVEEDVQRFFEAVLVRWDRIDALVNNVGIVPHQSRFDATSAGRWQYVFNQNVMSAMLCARAAIRQMSIGHGGRGGSIVNVSSMAATQGAPNRYIDYAMSKGALESFTIGLGKELAEEGIRVNAVRPGVVNTDVHTDTPDQMHQRAMAIPMKRIGQPDEVAQAIIWLCSPLSSYVTGTIIDVAGGR